jgi:hypothetical protein
LIALLSFSLINAINYNYRDIGFQLSAERRKLENQIHIVHSTRRQQRLHPQKHHDSGFFSSLPFVQFLVPFPFPFPASENDNLTSDETTHSSPPPTIKKISLALCSFGLGESDFYLVSPFPSIKVWVLSIYIYFIYFCSYLMFLVTSY